MRVERNDDDTNEWVVMSKHTVEALERISAEVFGDELEKAELIDHPHPYMSKAPKSHFEVRTNRPPYPIYGLVMCRKIDDVIIDCTCVHLAKGERNKRVALIREPIVCGYAKVADLERLDHDNVLDPELERTLKSTLEKSKQTVTRYMRKLSPRWR